MGPLKDVLNVSTTCTLAHSAIHFLSKECHFVLEQDENEKRSTVCVLGHIQKVTVGLRFFKYICSGVFKTWFAKNERVL